MGSINGQMFKRVQPGRVGLISLIARRFPDDGPSHMRRPIMVSVVCALISKMKEIRTWCDGAYDGPFQSRRYVVVSVSDYCGVVFCRISW